MKRFIAISISLLVVVFVGALAAWGVDALAIGGIGMAMAGAAVSGTVTSQEVKSKSADLDEDAVSQKITLMKPAATPLDTIMRAAGRKVKIDSFKTEYYAVDTRPLSDTVATAYVSGTTGGADGDTSYAIEVSNISMWNVDDTVLAKSVAGADTMEATFVVLAKDAGASTITLQPLNGIAGAGTQAGKTILPSLPLSTVLVRMGQAKYETDIQSTPFAMLPTKEYNYTQLYMAQTEQSIYQRMHGKEVNWNFTDMEALNIYDMRSTMELSQLFGSRSQFTDVSTLEEKYTTGGVTRYITKGLEYGTGGADRTVTSDNLIDWSKEIFSGNSGSDTRIMFVGNVLAASLMKITDVSRQLAANSTEVKWGITFKKIETNFGTLYVKHHPLFDLVGESDNGLVLDINNIEKHVWIPMNIKQLDLVKSGQKFANANVIQETSCLVVRYPDTHAKITAKA